MATDPEGRTPREHLVGLLADQFAGLRWGDPRIRRRTNEVIRGALDVAATTRVLKTAITLVPGIVPRGIRRNLARKPFSVRLAEFIGTLTPQTEQRLVKEAWTRGNPTWKLPPESSEKPSRELPWKRKLSRSTDRGSKKS